MVRILVLKRLYNLSDEQMEYQLLDRMSYKRFCGLANATNIPDRTTVWTFENRIGEAGAKALFDGVSAQLLRKGSSPAAVRSSTRPWCRRPSSTTAGARRPDRARRDAGRLEACEAAPEGPRRHLDQEARQEPLRLQALDQRRQEVQIIRKIETDTASTHDSQHFDNVFDTEQHEPGRLCRPGLSVCEEREAWLKENGFRNQIQRKGHATSRCPSASSGATQRIAKTRARVEHVFGAIEQMGGKLLRTIGQARANFAMTMMAACYNLKRLVYLPEGRNRGLLTPEMGRIAAARGDSRQKRGGAAGKGGDVAERN
jgi:IS5 family transposase